MFVDLTSTLVIRNDVRDCEKDDDSHAHCTKLINTYKGGNMSVLRLGAKTRGLVSILPNTSSTVSHRE